MMPDELRGIDDRFTWQPYRYMSDDGEKLDGWQRDDGAGYVIPNGEGRWWVSWAHPMRGAGGPGWHHHAFGSYASALAGVLAFDTVYALEEFAGNTDRCRSLLRDSGSHRNGENAEGG